MRLGIDASNLRAGGGATHITELLRAANPQNYGFNKVVVWGSKTILSRLEERAWLCKVHEPLLDKALPFRYYWQKYVMPHLVHKSCDLLFVPGGSVSGVTGPFVTICQNMLLFEQKEARRFGVSWTFLRLMLLRWVQSRTFYKASGIIFLTKYARDRVMKVIRLINGSSTIISHGVDARFVCSPREQHDIGYYSKSRPFRILYVSTIDVYKHQWHVVDAVARLHRSGVPVQLDLVGHAYKPALKRLKKMIGEVDSADTCVRYYGFVPYDKLPDWYKGADMFVFASSCENMPNILLEAMAAGLPIACSNKGPMFEILGDSGVYFDPEIPSEIALVLKDLIDSPSIRAQKAKTAYERGKVYTWKRCAEETFKFIADIKVNF